MQGDAHGDQLQWGVVYSAATVPVATTSPQLTFSCISGCTGADQLLGTATTLGSTDGLTYSAPHTGLHFCGGSACPDTATVTASFANQDFITHPLMFKFWGPTLDNSGYEHNNDHVMTADVINQRTLSFSAGDNSNY